MSSPAQQLKHRGAKPEKKNANGLVAQKNESLDEVLKSVKSTATSEWDYKVALVIITLMAFATRFWGIGHPDQVVFDEVHFGKVSRENATLPNVGFKQEICNESLLTIALSSSRHTTYNGPTSLTSTPRSESFSSRSWVGLLDTMAHSSSRISATHTLRTRSLTWRTGQCQHF